VAKLSRLTHKIAIQLHLVAESCCTIFISCSRRPRIKTYTLERNRVRLMWLMQLTCCG